MAPRTLCVFLSMTKGIFLGVGSDEHKLKTHWSVPIPVCEKLGDPEEGRGAAELHLLVARLEPTSRPLTPSPHRVPSTTPL